MWIKNEEKLFNTDNAKTIKVEGCKIIVEYPWYECEVIGEFWTVKEANNIHRSIFHAITNGEKVIMINNTRDGCKCLKKKPELNRKEIAKDLLDHNKPKPEIAFFG